MDALEGLLPRLDTPLLFPALRGGYVNLHNWRSREWRPAIRAAGIEPERRIYDLRHTYATFSLTAGVSLFTLSRRMGTSVEMIDRTYGHLAPDAEDYERGLLDAVRQKQRDRGRRLSLLVTPDAICQHRVAGSHLRALEGRPVMRLVVGLLSVVALAFAVPAAADPPTAFPFEDVFPDVNPCTGNIMTVTIAGTAFAHIHDSSLIFHSERTITTSDGFAGHGTDSSVQNGQMFMFRQADIMTNASGGLFLAKGVIVVDLSTETVRVERFELTCIRP